MSEKKWFALRVRYVKAEKVVRSLGEARVPMDRWFVPPVNGLLFVFSTREDIEGFIHFHAEERHVSFVWDKVTKGPIVVREKAMDDFIRICSVIDYPIVMTQKPQVKLGAKVRVVDGPLKGIVGTVVRMKKSRRILVEVDNVLWAATEFVGPEWLEVIEE